jgi:hypothetical protein
MSAWRKTALETLPEHRQLIEKSETPMALWVELQFCFSFEYKNHSDNLIGRFYKYAKWCLESSGHSDAGTAAHVAFYEHLTDGKTIQDEIYKWLSKEEFLKLEGAFRYHLEPKEYEQLKESFMEKRATFLQKNSKIQKIDFSVSRCLCG